MIKAIANADQALSKPIIYADNLPTSILLYPFAAFFHPKLIFLAYLSVYYFSGYDLHATLIYLMGTGICLLTTFILKKFTKRYLLSHLDPVPSSSPPLANPTISAKKKRTIPSPVETPSSLPSLLRTYSIWESRSPTSLYSTCWCASAESTTCATGSSILSLPPYWAASSPMS